MLPHEDERSSLQGPSRDILSPGASSMALVVTHRGPCASFQVSETSSVIPFPKQRSNVRTPTRVSNIVLMIPCCLHSHTKKTQLCSSRWRTCMAGAAASASVKQTMHMSSASCLSESRPWQPCRHGRHVVSSRIPPHAWPHVSVREHAFFTCSCGRGKHGVSEHAVRATRTHHARPHTAYARATHAHTHSTTPQTTYHTTHTHTHTHTHTRVHTNNRSAFLCRPNFFPSLNAFVL